MATQLPFIQATIKMCRPTLNVSFIFSEARDQGVAPTQHGNLPPYTHVALLTPRNILESAYVIACIVAGNFGCSANLFSHKMSTNRQL